MRLALLVLTILCATAAAEPPPTDDDVPRFRALVYSRTAGFRHASIPAGVIAIEKLGRVHRFAVHHTETPEAFTDEGLLRYDVVVFLNTTQDVLNDEQQEAFERFIRSGRGYVGVHAATDTEYEWAWYGRLVGAYFSGHPRVQEAAIDVENRDHPSTRMLPERWMHTDEWYDFRESPRGAVRVLASVDESSYEGGKMGDDHPVIWCHEFDGGRAWYTALGHTDEAFETKLVLAHLLGGLEWAAGVAEEEKKAPETTETPRSSDADS